MSNIYTCNAFHAVQVQWKFQQYRYWLLVKC